jgi:nicotinamidase-related amidase
MKMNKYLIVVDMQNDFISGALGTDEAKAIVPKVKEKIEKSIGNMNIYFTLDTHYENYLETAEGKNLPVKHCLYETEGWQIAQELSDIFQTDIPMPNKIIKKTFGSADLADMLKNLDKEEKIEEIELVGLCTDICVISNALLIKAFLPEVKITVDASCCAGVTPASHKNALGAMKMCHIEIVE